MVPLLYICGSIALSKCLEETKKHYHPKRRSRIEHNSHAKEAKADEIFKTRSAKSERYVHLLTLVWLLHLFQSMWQKNKSTWRFSESLFCVCFLIDLREE